MPRTKRKKSTSTRPAKQAPALPPLDPLRTGMPAQDSIVEVKQLKKGNKVYRLIITNEVDEYEHVAQKTRQKKR